MCIRDRDGNPNVKIEIINSKIKNNFNNNALFIKKGKVLIENSEVSYLNENSGVDVISIWQHNENEKTTYCEINNSKIYGVCQVNNSAKLKIRNSLILNASDTYNGPLLYSSDTDSILDLQEVHFLKKYNQDSADIHIAGPGKCYVDHNIYEISFLKDTNGDLVLDDDGKPFAREVGFESNLNGGKGITTEFFYKPLGYSLFFYDDERARDAIAISLNSSYLNEQTTSGQEDFTFQNEAGYENYPHNPKGIEFKHYENKNKIGLDISHVDVHDLAEGDQIAFKNEENNFTVQQHFIQGFKSYNNVNIGDPDLDENNDVRISNVSIKSQGLNDNDLPNLFELKGDFIEISRNDNLQQYNFDSQQNIDLIYDSDNSTPLTDPPSYKYLPTFRFNDNIWTSIKDPEFPLNIANKNYVDAEILDIFTRLNNLKLDDIIDVNTTGWLRNLTGGILVDDEGNKRKSTTQNGMILSYGPHELNDLDYSPGKTEDWHPKFINARPAFKLEIPGQNDQPPQPPGAPINNTPFVGTYSLDNIQNTYYSIHNQDWYDIIYNTDSVFRLRGINPLDTTKTGHIENGVGSSNNDYWNANEYSLFWNGDTTNQKSGNQKLHPDLDNDEPVHTAQEFDGNGEYSPVPIQSKIRLAKNYTYHDTDSSLQHDGSGKVYIAKTNEVKFGNQSGSYTYNARNRLGNSVTIVDNHPTPTDIGYAVSPEDLFAAYARRDMTNLTRAALGVTNEEGLILRHEDEVNYARWNLGFKTNFDENSDSVYLKYDRASDEYLSTDATFQYYQYTQILPGSEISSIVNSALDPELTPWNPLIANLNRYYMVTCDTDVNNRNLIILPSITSNTSGRSIVIKKENADGKLIIRTNDSSERLLLQDGVTILSDDNGIVQIDIDNMGHVIKFMSNGNSDDPYWIVEGFYGNGGVGFDVEANKEVIQDVIVAPLFIHDPTQPVTHDDAISFVYDAIADANDRIIAKINFATQEEVDDGTLANKPIAPDTYKTNLDDRLGNYTLLSNFTGLFNNNVDTSNTLTTKINSQIDAKIAGKVDRTELGEAAFKNVGFNEGELPEIGTSLTTNQFVITDANKKLKTGTIQSTENVLGLIYLATQTEVDNGTGDDAITPSKLLTALDNDSILRQKIIDVASASYSYFKLTGSAAGAIPPALPEFDLSTAKYYSIETDNSGQVTLNLPAISTDAVEGAIIRIKFKKMLSGFNVKIKPNGSDKIDGYEEWILEHQGQSIELVSDGISEWEIN